jgi:glutamyl-tRNA synthetase
MNEVRGRFAPSPTGPLHLGSALAALAAWCSVRQQGGRFIVRVEDLDGPRVVEGASAQQLESLRWLGLDWDEGPHPADPARDVGPDAPYRQSERSGLYEAALARLASADRLFPCRRSRKDVQELASAPHGASGLPAYPVRFRPGDLPADWFSDPAHLRDAALRFRVPAETVAFEDRVMGRIEADVRAETGDFVLKRRDGVYGYQLAVVVDDLAMGVTEVVRGADLLDSTARQIQLIRALGGAVPDYAHVPLLTNADGEKLSKRDDAPSLDALREAGLQPEQVIGWLARRLGQTESDAPLDAREVADRFRWERIGPRPISVPDDLCFG